MQTAMPAELPYQRLRDTVIAHLTMAEGLGPLLDRHRKRDQMDAPPDRFVDAVQRGLVVAGNDELERRGEAEEVLPHKPSGYPIATSQGLDLGFGPVPAFLDLLRRDKTGITQTGYIGRMPLASGGKESFRRGDGGMLARDAGQGVTGHPLQELRCAVVRGDDMRPIWARRRDAAAFQLGTPRD
jgi:hypothetical protein